MLIFPAAAAAAAIINKLCFVVGGRHKHARDSRNVNNKHLRTRIVSLIKECRINTCHKLPLYLLNRIFTLQFIRRR